MKKENFLPKGKQYVVEKMHSNSNANFSKEMQKLIICNKDLLQAAHMGRC